jgi:hypothetical protein
MRRALLGAVLLILGCGGVATLPVPSQSAPARTAAAIPTATIDVSDMMGAFPQTQFYVVTGDGVKAVALLNHATRFTVATEGSVQVAAGNAQVYVADETADGARLRWIDKVSGAILATRTEPGRKLVYTGTGNGALVVEPTTGRVLAMFADGARRFVDAYDAYSLRPAGRRLEAGCGDRLLAAADRVVVACLGGTLVIKDGDGTRLVDAGLGPLVAAAMRGDGTTLVGRSDGTLAEVRPATTNAQRVEPFRTGQLAPDGIAAVDANDFAIALGTSDLSVGVSELRSGRRYISFPAKDMPLGGLIAEGLFAYWVDGSQAKHIDLTQGFAETMTTFAGAPVRVGVLLLPGAVSAY